MEITIEPEMVQFIVAHFKKRIAANERMCPDYSSDIVQPDKWIRFADKADEVTADQFEIERRKKIRDFVKKAENVIQLLEQK